MCTELELENYAQNGYLYWDHSFNILPIEPNSNQFRYKN